MSVEGARFDQDVASQPGVAAVLLALGIDPRAPVRMLAAYDSGDHLHPGDAGYRVMAQVLADMETVAGDTR